MTGSWSPAATKGLTFSWPIILPDSRPLGNQKRFLSREKAGGPSDRFANSFSGPVRQYSTLNVGESSGLFLRLS